MNAKTIRGRNFERSRFKIMIFIVEALNCTFVLDVTPTKNGNVMPTNDGSTTSTSTTNSGVAPTTDGGVAQTTDSGVTPTIGDGVVPITDASRNAEINDSFPMNNGTDENFDPEEQLTIDYLFEDLLLSHLALENFTTLHKMGHKYEDFVFDCNFRGINCR